MTSKHERRNPWASESERMAAARHSGGQQSRLSRGLAPAEPRKRTRDKQQWCYRCGADHDKHR